jgi:hypothetical protein
MATRSLIAPLLCLAVILPARAADQAARPDFSGVWGRNTLDYNAPASGPGPLRNVGRGRTAGDYNSPNLKPWAADQVRKMGEISKNGEAFPTAHNQCWPEPPPYIFGNRETQILQLRQKVLIIYSHGSQVRTIRLNATHPAHVTPTWYGDSVGHYEAGALVVDTVGIKVAPLSTVDRYGTPHTEALHLTERYTLIDPNSSPAEMVQPDRGGFRLGDDIIDRAYRGKALQIAFTVEDPGTFNMPWSATVVARRALGPLLEDVCADQVHDYITGKDENVPRSNSGL